MTTHAETSTPAVLAASQPAFVDAHCHLHDPRFLQSQQDSLQAVITRARAANVRHIVSCACFEDDWAALEKLLSTWEQCSRVEDGSAQGSVHLTPSFGVHPWWAQSKRDDYLELLRAKLEQHPTASLGEIGLCKSSRGRLVDLNVQERVFQEQLGLATTLSRTCVIHCVGYYGKLLEILQKALRTERKLPPKIVLHSYGGGAEMATSFLALAKKAAPHTQIYFSLNAKQLTDSRSDKVAACCAAIPLRSLLLETDAPDQVPESAVAEHACANEDMGFSLQESLVASPSELNEPALVKIAYTRAAEIRDLPLEDLAAAVYQNSRAAFGIE